MNLPKQKAELLASRLKEKHLISKNVSVAYYRKRNHKLSTFFSVEAQLCYCNDIDGLFKSLLQDHVNSEWRLFIDSSKRSLKAVLLHNGNVKPSIPIAHSVHLKESYENMKLLLQCINYQTHQWHICGDLKVIGLLMGLQGGFTRHCCFLCMWNSRSTGDHYVKHDWENRTTYEPGKGNVKWMPLVDSKKIYLPPLHIKLGLMKNLVKQMANMNSQGYQYLVKKFPNISIAKKKAGIFIGPQIKSVLKDEHFTESLSAAEFQAWNAFKWLCENFLGNHRSPAYKEGVQTLLHTYHNLGCRMSLKIHFLDSHLTFFPDNLGMVSDEQGERFHKDIQLMERRYQGFWNASMMGDYLWMLYRDNASTTHARQSSSNHF